VRRIAKVGYSPRIIPSNLSDTVSFVARAMIVLERITSVSNAKRLAKA
jgi:hypothetical protein